MSVPAIEVRGLTKSFGSLPVAQAIDLSLAPGARAALIGPNGAGKTTFVNLLTGRLRADAGTVSLDGQSIDALSPAWRVRRGLVRTHQINTLLSETSARENVALAIAERDGRAWNMLRYARSWTTCLDEADARLAAMGFGARADEAAGHLPYGLQRLLEITIAISLKPRVLLLDEPAAGVPSGETYAIHDAVDRLPAETAVLMIEHDMDMVFRFAREIIVLVQGRVLTRGTPDEIAANAEVRTVYLGRSRS